MARARRLARKATIHKVKTPFSFRTEKAARRNAFTHNTVMKALAAHLITGD
jgi:hypothetical protein